MMLLLSTILSGVSIIFALVSVGFAISAIRLANRAMHPVLRFDTTRNALVKFGEGSEIYVEPRIPGESRHDFEKRRAATVAVHHSGTM